MSAEGTKLDMEWLYASNPRSPWPRCRWRQKSFQPPIARFGNFGYVSNVQRVGGGMSALGGLSYEIVIKLCCALSCRYPVNSLAVWTGSVANRNRLCRLASLHHGRCAEAGGKAT
jgi:hypothetical protein